MKTYTIITLIDNGMSYAYVGDFQKAPTFAQAKKLISKTGHQVGRVLAVVESVHRGLAMSSGMTFCLSSLKESI